MSSFVLGLDLDGVCGKYTEAFRAHCAKAFGVDPETLKDPTDWDFTKVDWGIVSRKHYESLHAQAVANGMFRDMEPMEGVSQSLWKLSDAGVHIRIITHRLIIKHAYATAAADTIVWAEKNNIPYRDLCFMADKPNVGAALYIDDSPSNLKKLREAGGQILIFDQPYNRDVEGPRVHNWKEATEYVLQAASLS